MSGRCRDDPLGRAGVRTCFADLIAAGTRLPQCVAGDVVAFLETGAYQESSASNFNALPRPATVLVDGDRAEVIRRAESGHDVWARDVVPERFASPPAAEDAPASDGEQ